MTVADNTSRNQYTATSGQTVFAYTFEIVDKDHIVVLQNGTALSEGTDYTVSNVGNDNGGNITLTSGATAGDVMTLYREMPYSRTQNYTNSGDFLASEVNADFDELWLAGEQTDRSFSQSIRKPITDSDSISMELPEAADRANKFVKFDATGAVDVAGATVTVPADAVTIDDAGNYYTSNDVEGALQEVGADLDSINTDLGTKLSNVVEDTTPQLGGDLDLNSNNITGTGNVNITGNVALSGTVDGRDVAADGTKLDGIAAGAEVNAVDSVNTQTGAVVLDADDIDDSTTTHKFTTASDISKLAGIEAGADVTDTANVTAAGAVMDSELTNESAVKALDQGVATTDSPSFAGLTVDTNTLKVDSTNNRVGILNATPDVALDVGSATDAVHVPVGTTAERPSTPAAGYLRYNSTTGEFEGYTTEWGSIGGGTLTDVSVDSFTGTGTQTAFTLSGDPGSENNLQVYVDGVYQNKDTFTVVSTTLTFSEAPPLDALIEACTFNEIGSIIVPADGSVNSAKIASGAVTSSKLGGDLTTPGNLDVTGSVTADSATIDGAVTVNGAGINLDDAYSLTWGDGSAQVRGSGSSEAIDLRTASTTRLNIDADGDLSLYNSAGTSQDLYWDASTSRLGLGTTSPSAAIDIEGSGGGAVQAVISDGANQASLQLSKSANFYGIKAGSDYGGLLFFSNSATEAVRIDSSGNVGINNTNPDTSLHIGDISATNATGNGRIKLEDASGSLANDGGLEFVTSAFGSGYGWKVNSIDAGGGVHLAFGTRQNSTTWSEKARLDASGNLLVGGTETPASSQGNLALFNGVVPTGGVTDGIVLYAEDVSSSSELKVRDEAGNITTLSPHNFELIPEGPSEDMAWSYFSEKDGKQINVDMLKAIRLLERMSGEKLVFEN